MIFAGSSGVNTVDDPARIQFNYKTGVSDLQYAVNVNVERTGRVSRRPGYTQLESGTFHSLWRDSGDCFVAKGTSLYQVLTDKTLLGIRSGLTGDRIAYAQHGDKTYYSNGTENGVVKEFVSSAWPTHEYTGPDTNKTFSSAPLAHHLAIHKGRMFMNPVDDPNIICWSESGGLFGLFAMAKNHRKFDSKILMILSVTSGLFVSTERSTYFTREVSPNNFTLETKANYPAFEWSECQRKVDGVKLGLEGMCALWRGKRGACCGTSDGQMFNMTENKIAQTTCGGVGASVLHGAQFIHSTGI